MEEDEHEKLTNIARQLTDYLAGKTTEKALCDVFALHYCVLQRIIDDLNIDDDLGDDMIGLIGDLVNEGNRMLKQAMKNTCE